MRASAAIFALTLGLASVSAHPSVLARDDTPTSGDLASGKLNNMPQSSSQVKCEDHPYSNDDIFAAGSYAHALKKAGKTIDKPSGNKGKVVPYPHPNSPEKSTKNKFGNSDVSLEGCSPGDGKNFIEFPILRSGSLWTDGTTDPGPDRILIQYLDDSTAAYCGTIYHFPAGTGRSSAFDVCTNSAGGNLTPASDTPPSPCAAGGCEEGPPGGS